MSARRAYLDLEYPTTSIPLPTPEALDAVPVDALAALIMQLAALAMRAAARLAQTPRPDPGAPGRPATPEQSLDEGGRCLARHLADRGAALGGRWRTPCHPNRSPRPLSP